ncbi:MAG: hypothetical protein HY782_21145 [Chloroflexi bacterium]|nr:hypothetical protein [Chloroflexota bacterium]
MSAQLLETLMKQAESLSVQEQLTLAAHLVEQASKLYAPPERPRWRDIRGLAYPSLFGEDAQAYISRTRRESDEHRERRWKR